MSLIAWYPLNGNMENYGIGDMDLSVSTTPTYAAGKIGQALSGGGTSTWTAAQTASILNNNELSICFWIKVLNTTSRDIIFGNAATASTTNNRKFSIYQSPTANDLHLSWQNETSNEVFFSCAENGVFPTGEWTHCAITYKNPDIKIYINGSLYKSYTGVSNSSSFSYSTTVTRACASRLMNDYRFYDHALSPKEIKEISKGLILHYPMNEMDGLVGGRNLAKNSSQGWSSVQYNIMHGSMGGLGWEVGKTYTISLKGSIDSNGVFGVWADSGSYHLCTLSYDSETGIYVGTGTVSSTAAPTQFSLWNTPNGHTGYNATIEWIKIEEGTIATPWTPAPEDFGTYNTIYDASGYNNHGTVTNTSCPIWSDDSIIGRGSYEFDGAAKYIAAGRGAMVKDELTVAVWAYMENWSTYNGRIASCTDGGGWNFEPMNGYMNFAMGTGASSNTYVSITSTTPLANLSSGWHHFAGTYDGLSGKIYIDGNLDNTVSPYTTKTSIYYNSSNTIFVGAEAAGNLSTPQDDYYFNGKINDFRIYSTALSDTDIKDLYETRFSLAKDGSLYCNGYVETGDNLLDCTNDSFVTGTMINGLGAYTQSNCQASIVDGKLRIYRPPNLTHNSETMHNMWGGLMITLDNINPYPLKDNHTYIVIIHVEGQTSNGSPLNTGDGFRFHNYMGWNGGGLTPIPSNVSGVGIPDNFQGEMDIWYKFTINDGVNKVCTTSYANFTQGTVYRSYKQLGCGWGYTNTGSLGTDIYFSNIRMYDITDIDGSAHFGKNGILETLALYEEDGCLKLGNGFVKSNLLCEN